VAWDAWGESVIYTVHRINGSGIRQTWVVDSRNGIALMAGDGVDFTVASWRQTATINSTPLIEAAREENVWVSSHFIEEKEIGVGFALDGMHNIATGLAPKLHPDEVWLSYLTGDELRIVSTDGKFDRLVLDLAPLGGRDRHFASAEDCFQVESDACSYRPPVVNWGP
jgi:hypothetical protein